MHHANVDEDTYTVARGDWTQILIYYFDEPGEEGEEDWVPVQQCAGGVDVDASPSDLVNMDESTGKLTFVKNGSVTLTFTAYNGVKRTVRFAIIDPPERIELQTDGPAMCTYTEYKIMDLDRNVNILEQYSFFHYTITSSNSSAIHVYRYPKQGALPAYGLLVAGKKAASTITVKLFSGVSCIKSVAVRREPVPEPLHPQSGRR